MNVIVSFELVRFSDMFSVDSDLFLDFCFVSVASWKDSRDGEYLI